MEHTDELIENVCVAYKEFDGEKSFIDSLTKTF